MNVKKNHCDYRRASDAFAFIFHTNCGILLENSNNNNNNKKITNNKVSEKN